MKDRRDAHSELRRGYEAAAEFYDLFAKNDDIPFYLDYARKQGSPILDLAAGAGRVSFTLAREGFEVVALENSEDMLRVARQRHKDLTDVIAKRVTIIEGDFTDFTLNQQFSLIIIPASFGHALTRDEQLSTLSCVRSHLRDNGLFVLDLFPRGVQPESASFEDVPVELPDGRIVRRVGEMRVDPARQILELKLRFIVSDPRVEPQEEECIELLSGAALIYSREADLLLRMSDLEIVEEFGDFDKRPFSSDCGRRILVLRKSS